MKIYIKDIFKMSTFKVSITDLFPYSIKTCDKGFKQINLSTPLVGEMNRKKFYIFFKLNNFLYMPITTLDDVKDETLDILYSKNKNGPKIKDEFEGFLNEVIDVIKGEGEYKSFLNINNLPNEEGNFIMELFPQLLSYLKGEGKSDEKSEGLGASVENFSSAYSEVFSKLKTVLKKEFESKDSAFIFKELLLIKSYIHRKDGGKEIKSECPNLTKLIGFLENIKILNEQINWEKFLNGDDSDSKKVNLILNLIMGCNSIPRMRLIDTIFNATINHLYFMIIDKNSENTSDLICKSLYSTIQAIMYDEDIDHMLKCLCFSTYSKTNDGKRRSHYLKSTLFDELLSSYVNCKFLPIDDYVVKENIYNRFINILTINKCELSQRFNTKEIKTLRLLPYIFEFKLTRRERIFNYLNRSIEILFKMLSIKLPINRDNLKNYINQIYYPNALLDEENLDLKNNLIAMRKHEQAAAVMTNAIEFNINDFCRPFLIDNVPHSLSPQSMFLPIIKEFMNNRNTSIYLLRKDKDVIELSSKYDNEKVLYEFNSSNGSFSIYEINKFIKSFIVNQDLFRDVLREVDSRSRKYIVDKLEMVASNNSDSSIDFNKIKESIVKDFIITEKINPIDKLEDLKLMTNAQIVKYSNEILSFGSTSNPPFIYSSKDFDYEKFIKQMKKCSIEIYHIETINGIYLYKQLNGPNYLKNSIKTGKLIYTTTRQNFANHMELLCANFYISTLDPYQLKKVYLENLN